MQKQEYPASENAKHYYPQHHRAGEYDWYNLLSLVYMLWIMLKDPLEKMGLYKFVEGHWNREYSYFGGVGYSIWLGPQPLRSWADIL